jgi:glutathione S-transferase
MRLISATPSPWARKVRILLLEKSVAFDLVDDVPWDPDTCVPAYNPLEKLPILITDDGESVYDSRLIVDWIERRFPDPPMIPAALDEWLAAKRLEVLADGVCDAMLLCFRELSSAEPDQDWIRRQRRKIAGGLDEIARRVGEQDLAVGDRFSLGDAAVAAALGGLDSVADAGVVPESAWREGRAALAAYFGRLEQRASVAATRPIPFDHIPAAFAPRGRAAA